jgi:valyl-tRNA synthetase
MIQDGQGRKMSKSLGNGIDPLKAIDSHGTDAMRFTLASMTTDTQDIRMPVKPIKMPDGRTINTSPKFDVGRNFCNKLWNASRFAMMNLEGTDTSAFNAENMDTTDKWILSRLASTIKQVTWDIENFKYSEPVNLLYKFFWNDLCDWYLEWSKPKMQDPVQKATSQNILAFILDQILRLLHPFMPFITEGIYQNLNELIPHRELKGLCNAPDSEALITAQWPKQIDSLINDKVQQDIDYIQTVIRSIREIRNNHTIAPSKKLTVSVKTTECISDILNKNQHLIIQLAHLDEFNSDINIEKPQNAAVTVSGAIEVYVHDAVDAQAERIKLQKQRELIQRGLNSLHAKLSNENFVKRAKPEVVAQSRTKQTELQQQLATIEKYLTELD